MKSKFLKVISVLLILSIVFMLAACGGKSDVANQSTSEDQSKTSSEAEDKAAEDNDEEVYDVVWAPWGQAPEEDDLYPQKYLEDKFKVNFKLWQFDPQQRQQQLSILFASGDIPDFISGNLQDLSNYVSKKFIREIPIDAVQQNMPNFYKWNMEMDDKLFAYSTLNSKNYGLPMPSESGKYVNPMVFRQDWLTAIGYTKAPETLEEYEDVFRKFRNNDPDGNGKMDTYALSNPSDFNINSWFTPIFGAFGTIPGMWIEKDGKVIYGFTDKGTLEAIKLLAKWNKEGLIDPEWVTDKSADRTGGPGDLASKFAKGRIGLLYHFNINEYKWYAEKVDPVSAEVTSRWQQYNESWSSSSFDKVYACGDAPKGASGQGVTKNGVVSQYGMIGAKVDDKKLVRLLKMIEAITTDRETYVTTAAGKEGEHHILQDCEYSPSGKTAFWSQTFLDELDGKATKNLTKMGTSSHFNPWIHWNKNIKFYFAGNILYERQELAEKFSVGPGYESPIKVALPSMTQYPDLEKTISEFIMKAIMGEISNIDEEYNNVVNKWMKAGGEQLTKEANDIFNSNK